MVFTGWLGLRYFAKFWGFFRGSLGTTLCNYLIVTAILILQRLTMTGLHFGSVANKQALPGC
jgi:hypothetical protein